MAIGYIDRDPSYRVGSRSQAYWVLPPYDRVRLIRRQITDTVLCYNIRTWHEERRRALWQRIRRNETPVDAAVCEHLWRHLQRVWIDADICLDNITFRSTHQASVYQVAIEHLRHRELWITVDDHGRIHTNLTNFPKMLRQYLVVDGVRLANVDISESQPLFKGLALAKAESGGTADGQAGGRREGRRGQPYHMMDSIMMDKDTLLGGGFDRKRLSADRRRYLELCEARGLYQAVADRLGRTREEAKRRVMVVFFDKPWHRNAVIAVLDELFPTVMEDMREIKRGNHCRLAHFAQRVESAFMFGRVIPRIMTLRPELFVATIHDSVLTPLGDAAFVRQVMLEQFAQLGVSPQVKIEPCSKMRCEGKTAC